MYLKCVLIKCSVISVGQRIASRKLKNFAWLRARAGVVRVAAAARAARADVPEGGTGASQDWTVPAKPAMVFGQKQTGVIKDVEIGPLSGESGLRCLQLKV